MNYKYAKILIVSLLFFFAFGVSAQTVESCASLYEAHANIIDKYDSNQDGKIFLQESYTAVSAWFEYGYTDNDLLGLLKFARQGCVIPSFENDPASGTLSASAIQAAVGETITLTVTGKDNDGLQNLWAYYQGSWHNKTVQGTTASATFAFSESKVGTYTYKGYVYGSQPSGIKETAWTEPSSVKVTVVVPIQACTDSDGGISEYVHGNVEKDNGTFYDACQSATKLKEWYCTDSGVSDYKSIICENGCVDGVCKKDSGNDSTTGVVCIDSDDGRDYYTYGNVKHADGRLITYDICEGDLLKENYCDNGYYAYEWHKCANGCEDGVCLKQDCQYYYWFDNNTTTCGYKQFCGAFVYYGLRTFETRNECEDALPQVPSYDLASGTLSVSSAIVEPGENITLTITGQDDNGLYALLAYYKGEWHKELVQGLSADATFTFSESQEGTYPYFGYVYGKTQSGNLEFNWTEPKMVMVTVRGDIIQLDEPDLIISSVSTSPSSLTTADEVDFRITIKNIGDQQMPAVSGGIITKVSSASMSAGSRICDAMTTRLKAGESATIDCSIAQKLSKGSHNFTFLVDSSNRLAESNESNNQFSKIVQVSSGVAVQNDPISGTFSTSANSVTAGNSFTLKVAAQDDQGVDKIKIYYKGAWHTFECEGQQISCVKSQTISESSAGTYPYYAKVYGYDLNGNSESNNTNPSYVRVVVSASIAATCTDSDGGANYSVKGSSSSSVSGVEGRIDCCKLEYSTNMGDSVNHIGPGGGACVSTGPYLYEAICGTDGNPTTVVYQCPNGCKDGVCVSGTNAAQKKGELSLMVASIQALIENLLKSLQEMKR